MKNNYKKHIIAFFTLTIIIYNLSNAQIILSLDSSIKSALKNNYSIQIAQNETEIYKNNNDYGNAGFYPQLKANSGLNLTNNSSFQEFSNGTSSDYKGVNGTNKNAAINLNWTLFDGTKMFISKNKLEQFENMGYIKLKIAVEDLVYKVITQYYSIIRQKQQIKATETIINLYEKRLEIAKIRKNSGSASEVDFLQATVDLNIQKSNLIKQQAQLQILNYQFGKTVFNKPDSNIDVSDSIILLSYIDIKQIKENLIKENNYLKISEINLNLSKIAVNEYKSNIYPRVGFGLGYGYSNTTYDAGSTLKNNNHGLNYGLTATWTLFDGFNIKRNIKISKIQYNISEAQYNETKLQLELSYLSIYKVYESSLQIIKLDEENAKSARFNLDIALEKYKLGSISDIALKDIQRSYEDAILRLINSRYDAKISETDLMKLSGMIVK